MPGRYGELNAHATKHRLTPFSALSNQLSLAEMLEPVWEGCLAASRVSLAAGEAQWLNLTEEVHHGRA